MAYDGVLRLEMPTDCFLVGYADDVAAVIQARTIELAQVKLDVIMRRITRWMDEHGLTLATSKTEVVLFTRKRIPTIIPIQVGGTEVWTKPAAKYLGIMLDTKITFWEQIKQATDRASQRTTALSRLMGNINGPRPCKRRLLMTVVHSILLYGAEVWADALNIAYYRKRMIAVQRRGALRIACAYRTVSEPAILVLARVIPIQLLATERKRMYERRTEGPRTAIAKEERERTVTAWQEMWTREVRGRWTARLVPDVQTWLQREHGEVNYFTTQFLSGHGLFYAYLHRIGKVATPSCLSCDGVADDALHTFFECSQWGQDRNALRQALNRTSADLTPEIVMSHMLSSQADWTAVSEYVEVVLTKKMVMERVRQRAEQGGQRREE